MNDIANYLVENKSLPIVQTDMKAVSTACQLLMVTPKSSIKHIDKVLYGDDLDHYIKSISPIDFQLETLWKFRLYESIPIIPNPDYKRIEDYVDKKARNNKVYKINMRKTTKIYYSKWCNID